MLGVGSSAGVTMSNSANTIAVEPPWYAIVWRWIKWPLRAMRSARNSVSPVSTRLTREGLQFAFMILFVLLGAVLRDVNLLIILAGTLLAMMFIQWRVCGRTLYGLSVTRRLPRSMHARKGFDIELVLRNPKRWLGSWLVLAQDRMVYAPEHTPISRASQAIGILFSSVPPQSTRSQRYRCVVQRRGRYQFKGLELTTRFPLGLMRGILPVKSDEYFIVQPAIGRMLPTWTELFNVRSTGARHRRVRSLSDEGEFFGLRDYRAGDSPRWIHWRSSARRDELVVKQFQQPESREIIVLLDLYHPQTHSGNPTNAEITALEKLEDNAIEFVATLLHQMATSNIGSVTLAIADHTPTVASRVQSRAQCTSALERLAIARTPSQDTLSQTLHILELEHQRIEKLIVVSTRPAVDKFESLDADGKQHAVFWRSVQWLNATSSDFKKYFVPAE